MLQEQGPGKLERLLLACDCCRLKVQYSLQSIAIDSSHQTRPGEMQNDVERKSRICRRYKTRPKHQLRANQTPIRNLHIFRSPSSKILHKTIRSRLQMRSHSQIPCNLQTRCNLQFRYNLQTRCNLQIPYNLQFRCNLPEQATLNHFDQRLCCSLNRLKGFQTFECFRLDLEFFRFRPQILSDLMFFRPGVISVQSHEVSAHTRQLNRLTKLRVQTFCSPKEDLITYKL